MAQPIDTTKLTNDLRAGLESAKTTAIQTATRLGDGGSSNFDAPQFYFNRSPSAKQRQAYETALNAVGLTFFWTDGVFGGGKNRRLVFGPGCGGQGFTRTKAAEAFSLFLQAQGWENVSMYYQVD